MSIKITTVEIAIERAVTVAPYTVHKVRVGVQADIPEDETFVGTLNALEEAVSLEVDNCIAREKAEYGSE